MTRQMWPWLFVVGTLAYLSIDGHPESWLTGLPWRPLALAIAVVGGVALWALWPPSGQAGSAPGQPGSAPARSGSAPSRWWRYATLAVCVLALLKLPVGWQALPAGLPGWYYDNSRFQGAVEHSSDFRGEPWTRRERELFFGGDELPAYFLNDVQRFNFFGPEAERRRNIPFSVRWEGALYVPRDGTYRLWLTASGPGRMRVDGQQVALVDADGRETYLATLTLAAGSHPIEVSYARRPPRSPDLKVEWDVDGERQPLRLPYLFPEPVAPDQWGRDRLVLVASRGLDAIYLALLALVAAGLLAGFARRLRHAPTRRWQLVERAVLGVWLVAIFWSASVPRLDRVDKLELLGGGQDWLTHESFARDILINGPLMTLGKPLGAGSTFYAQPFYPYALAAMHALTGEDLFGVVVLQRVGAGLAGVLLYFLARRLFGPAAALAAFALYLPLWAWHLEWVASRLLSEAIYFVILPALLLVLVRCLDERRPRDFLLAGLLLGLAIVTRGPTLLFVPFVAAILWIGLRRPAPSAPARGSGRRGEGGLSARTRSARLALLAALLLVAGLVVSLVPIRNYLVAGEPALLASSGSVNLQKLHRPTDRVRLSWAQDRWFAAYIQDAPTRETVEFLLQDPGGYAYATLLLAAYTLGYGSAIEESQVAAWPELIALNLLYLVAVVALPAARSSRAGLLHAFVAIHFLTMVIFVPYDYDNRLVLPMYLPIVVIAAYLVSEVALWVVGRARGNARVRSSVPERSASWNLPS